MSPALEISTLHSLRV